MDTFLVWIKIVFLVVFFFHVKIVSFKKSDVWAIGCHLRFTFWLTFFFKVILPLFCSGKTCP